MLLNVIFAVIGLGVGVLVNSLADYLPERRLDETAVSFQLTPSGLWQLVKGQSTRHRPWLVELSTIILYALLPSLIPTIQNLIVNSFHIAVLILIIVIDLEHRLIFNVVVFPATLIAFLGTFIVTNDENTIRLALAGAVAGFIMFFVFYKLAQLIYGKEAIALGMGDVNLSMTMGAMLGFHRIFFALILGIFLGGIITILLLLSRRVNRRTFLPYGQYLAVAGIIMLIWGADFAWQYIQP